MTPTPQPLSLQVAIQGTAASFHEIAALQFFGSDITSIECSSFREVCEQLKTRRAQAAIMAIENAIYGSILTNYGLIRDYQLKITGEVYLPIAQHLMALPGETHETITAVYSHPIALQQCSDYFARFPHWRLVESRDTAQCACDIRQNQSRGIAAVAGQIAAQRYGLNIIASNIHNYKRNSTRFLALAHTDDYQPVADPDKASLSLQVHDKPGALARILQVFDACNINLSKLQSVPVAEKPFYYAFQIDAEWNNYAHFQQALHNIQPLCQELNILGEYKRGKKVFFDF